jgi:thermolabile hemolysin
MVAILPSIQSSHKINELYVFGDSLSDVGNIFRATGGVYPSSPPYFQGRYSNGLVWVEYLTSELELTAKQNVNFACGGATTGSSGINGIPGLLTQVYSFTKTREQLNPDGLYIFWAGANDYIYGAANTAPPIENITQAIASLSLAGAKKFLVANLPDLGNLPATRNNSNSRALNSLTIAHNLGLEKSLDALKQKLGSGTQIINFDVNSLYKETFSNPEKFGLTNVTHACLSNISSGESADKFLFWDGIHPTTAGHKILATTARDTLKVALQSKSPFKGS